jgi:hypothetical protein
VAQARPDVGRAAESWAGAAGGGLAQIEKDATEEERGAAGARSVAEWC